MSDYLTESTTKMEILKVKIKCKSIQTNHDAYAFMIYCTSYNKQCEEE